VGAENLLGFWGSGVRDLEGLLRSEERSNCNVGTTRQAGEVALGAVGQLGFLVGLDIDSGVLAGF